MAPIIVYDLTRLFLGPLNQSPRGIDRVDIALADHFFANEDCGNIGILPTPWGIRGFPAGMVKRGLEHLHQLWAERIDEGADPQWGELVANLCGTQHTAIAARAPKRLTMAQKTHRMLRHLMQTGMAVGCGIHSLPRHSIYLNIGQIGLAIPAFTRWLEQRRDMTAAFMLHDTIPLEYPHFVSPAAAKHHSRMVRSAVEHADLVITTTQHARECIVTAMEQMGRSDIPVHVEGLPLPHAMGVTRTSDHALIGQHYFLTCSTVEPRKNHGLLIDAWRRICMKMGEDAPHLVIVGSLGRHAENILAPVAQDPILSRRIHHVAGLSSPALARLMLGAAAMLCPSHAEGFGLSVLEANVLGVPTIASDIAAHREIANNKTWLLPPTDIDGWERAILAHGPSGTRHTPDIPTGILETSYCERIAGVLHHFAQNSRRDPL